MLPHVVRFNAAVAAEGYAELADAAGLDAGAEGAGPAAALARRIEGLRAAAGLPGRLAEVGVSARALAELAADAATPVDAAGSTRGRVSECRLPEAASESAL